MSCDQKAVRHLECELWSMAQVPSLPELVGQGVAG